MQISGTAIALLINSNGFKLFYNGVSTPFLDTFNRKMTASLSLKYSALYYMFS